MELDEPVVTGYLALKSERSKFLWGTPLVEDRIGPPPPPPEPRWGPGGRRTRVRKEGDRLIVRPVAHEPPQARRASTRGIGAENIISTFVQRDLLEESFETVVRRLHSAAASAINPCF